MERTVKELMSASPHESEIVKLTGMPGGLVADAGATEDSINSFEVNVAGWSIMQWGVLWGASGTAGVITVEGRAFAGEGATSTGTTAATRGWSPAIMYRDDSLTTTMAGASSVPVVNAIHRYVVDVSGFEVVRFRVSTALTNTMQSMYYKLLSRHESMRKSNAAAITSTTVTASISQVASYGVAVGGVGAGTWPTAVSRVLKSASARAIMNVFLRNSGTGTIYLRLYDKSTAPVAGDVPLKEIKCGPGETIFEDYGSGIWCPTGVGYALTGGTGDSDNTAPPTGGVLRIKTAAA